MAYRQLYHSVFVSEMKQHLEMKKHFSEMIFGIVLGRLAVKRRFELELQRYLEMPIELQSGIDPEMQQKLDLRRRSEMPTEPESGLDPGMQHSSLLESLGPEMGLDLETQLATET